MFFLNYQWTRNRNDSDATGLMPTLAERNGDLSDVPVQVINPLQAHRLRQVDSEVAPQSAGAGAVAAYIRCPTSRAEPEYNYQIQSGGNIHQDSLQTRMMKTLGRKNQLLISVRVAEHTLGHSESF